MLTVFQVGKDESQVMAEELLSQMLVWCLVCLNVRSFISNLPSGDNHCNTADVFLFNFVKIPRKSNFEIVHLLRFHKDLLFFPSWWCAWSQREEMILPHITPVTIGRSVSNTSQEFFHQKSALESPKDCYCITKWGNILKAVLQIQPLSSNAFCFRASTQSPWSFEDLFPSTSKNSPESGHPWLVPLKSQNCIVTLACILAQNSIADAIHLEQILKFPS